MNIVNELKNLQWDYVCPLSEINSNHSKLNGVYIWIFNGGSKNRIIYVGTAFRKDGLYGRTKEHLSDLKNGQYTIFKFEENEDPYKLLGTNKESMDELIRDKVMYYPYNKLTFLPNWAQEYLKSFIPKVQVWICPIETSKSDCWFLESQIQIILKYKFNIGYSTKKRNHTWLGAIQRSGKPELLNYSFKFINFPKADDMENIFSNLLGNVKEQLNRNESN